MADVAKPIIFTRPRRVFKNNTAVTAVAVTLDGCRMVSGSPNKILYLWDLKGGTVLKKMEGHRDTVWAVAISGDGKIIASGDRDGEYIAWDGDTGNSLTRTIKAHSDKIGSLDFSPDSAVLATVSLDKTIKLWSTTTWKIRGTPINVREHIDGVRYSPSGEFLAIVLTSQRVQIWKTDTSERIAELAGNSHSLVWTPDGTRLLSGGNKSDPTIREWDTSTWKQVGDPWSGHTRFISALAIDTTGTFLASASHDGRVRLWRISDRRNIAVFRHSHQFSCVTFSVDGKYILCGGEDGITEWGVPEGFIEGTSKAHVSTETLQKGAAEEQRANNTRDSHSKVLSVDTVVRNAFLSNDLSAAQELLTRQINLDRRNHNAYAHRSFVSARKCDWDNALHDALISLSIRPSLTGYISKAISLCGRMEFNEATKAFDLAFMFTDEDTGTIHLILLVKAIALFNANQQEEAMRRIQELADVCSHADTHICHVVQAYLRIQMGINALDDARYNEAADHFTAAIDNGILPNEQVIHSKYEIFIILFGWDLASSWQIAHKNRCYAFLQAGKLVEAHETYTYMMNMCDEATKAGCLGWSTAFKKECSALRVAIGDAALAASAYDRAIELYSAVIDLDFATDSIFAHRCQAKLGKMLWAEALDDAQKVTELNPSSYLGYYLKHAALHGAGRYDEAIEAFQSMLFRLDDDHDLEVQSQPQITHAISHPIVSPALRQQYVEAQCAIQNIIDAQMEHTPPRLLQTSTGRLCDRESQINAFKTSTQYRELLLLLVEDANLQVQRIQDVVAAFFSYVMLSHRWEGKEARLHEIQDEPIYELNSVSGIVKLQSFCKVVQDAGYRWAWVDTCCIDQTNNVELQRSVNSMFAWYHHSTLTIIYLSDVPPSSRSGAMARSVWNTRGWTVQEFLAPKIVLFYQNDWTLYLDDTSPNHKKSAAIMQELEKATGINKEALTGFRPGMRDAREKLQWASNRVTTLPEDIAYSLFGIFGVHLPVIYGETKQNSLGRLLQEIIAQSGDITCLDWIGKSSEFNSCLPANITSYAAPPFIPPSLSEEEMEALTSSLRDAAVVELASQLYTTLEHLSAPRFAHRRLHLPCIVFTVTEVSRKPSQEEGAYTLKTNSLDDLLISTEDKLIPFSRRIPIRQELLIVRPWDRNFLESYDFADPEDDARSIRTENSATPLNVLSGDDLSTDSESDSRALRLIARLGQPFRAFLVAQRRGGEYSRIAADYDIIAQIKDRASVHDMMDVRTLEIL